MPGPTQERPHLGQLFAEGIMQRFVKKPLWGKPYMECSSHLMLGAYLYERAAILGRARSQSLPLLLQMCSSQEETSALEKFARDSAQGRLSRFAGSPANFPDFYLTTEAALASGQSLPPGSGFLFLEAHAKRKVPLRTSMEKLSMSTTEALAFGTIYPDLVNTMLRSYGEIDTNQWRFAREAGLDIPAEPPAASVEQLEQEVLSVVAPFVAHFYPHLVKPLNLSL